MRPSFAIYLLVLALGIVHSAIYYPRLPITMASHFNGDGTPTGWSSKAGYFQLEGVILLILFAAFILLPRLLPLIGSNSIAIPNRRYWLAPERREASTEFFISRLGWFAAANILFLICVNQLVFDANLSAEGKLDSPLFIAAMALYFAFAIIWIITFFRRFRRAGV